MLHRLLDNLYDTMLSRRGLGLLALALVINVGAMVAIDGRVEALNLARESVSQSRTVIDEIHRVNILLVEAESAQRGFLYTDNKDYLTPLHEGERKISATLDKLAALVAGSDDRKQLVERVKLITQEVLKELNKTIAIQQMGQKDTAREVVMTDQGRQLMEELDRVIAQLASREDQVGLQRLHTWEGTQSAMRWGFATILVINVMLLLAGAITIMRDMAGKRAELVRLDERAAVLASEVAQRAEELRALTAHLLRVQEEERRTIARELHDELGGTLSAVKMDIIMGRDAASKRGDDKSVVRLQRAHASIDSAIQFARRLIEDLRPTLLDNLGFEAALRSMTEQFSERTGCQCVISLPSGALNLTSVQSTVLYRICQEALTNVMKYAKASRVTIILLQDGQHWKLLLSDDGVGLDATKQHRTISHGLIGMRERLVALGGTFDIRGVSGQGTTITATFPLTEGEPPAA